MAIHVCCKGLFKMFYLFLMYVASAFIWMLHMLQLYVLNVSSYSDVCCNCFICLVKLDLDTGLLSEEERVKTSVLLALGLWAPCLLPATTENETKRSAGRRCPADASQAKPKRARRGDMETRCCRLVLGERRGTRDPIQDLSWGE
jgi:hypothetical protein